MLTYTMPILAFTNEETIYSKLDSNGEKYKSIVSSFSENDEIVQNETEKELPVDCKVKYELNGKVVTAEELVGKSGKVKITLEYINKLENTVDINGETEILYTPFFVVSGTVIDNEKNKNIEISNGKIINDGSKTIVMGIAIPGMKESLKVLDEDFEIPSKIEITMDSENFEIGNIMSFATPHILEDGDLDDILDKTDELFDQVNSLQDATNQLQEGSIKLNDGVVVLNDGAKSLSSGASELESGINTLKSGTSKITSGANSLKSGTQDYTAKSKEFNDAMKQITDGANNLNSSYDGINNGLAGLNAKAPELVTGAESLKTGIDQIYGGLSKISSSLSVQGGNSVVSVPVSVTPNNSDKISKIQSITNSNENLINSLEASNTKLQEISNTVEDENIKNSLKAQIDENSRNISELRANATKLNGVAPTLNEPVTCNVETKASDTSGMTQIKASVDALASATKQLSDGASVLISGAGQTKSAIEQLAGGSVAVKAGLNNLANSSNTVLDANNKLTEAASTIANGAKELANGASSLDQGANKLSSGSASLKNGTTDLSNGTNTLLNGSNELVDGIKKFNDDGIKKINKYVNKDLKNTVTRMEKLQELSSNYNRFASEEERASIKFINIMDSIKTSAREKKDEDIVINKDDNSKKGKEEINK